jgi:hypothetical protein
LASRIEDFCANAKIPQFPANALVPNGARPDVKEDCGLTHVQQCFSFFRHLQSPFRPPTLPSRLDGWASGLSESESPRVRQVTFGAFKPGICGLLPEFRFSARRGPLLVVPAGSKKATEVIYAVRPLSHRAVFAGAPR